MGRAGTMNEHSAVLGRGGDEDTVSPQEIYGGLTGGKVRNVKSRDRKQRHLIGQLRNTGITEGGRESQRWDINRIYSLDVNDKERKGPKTIWTI